MSRFIIKSIRHTYPMMKYHNIVQEKPKEVIKESIEENKGKENNMDLNQKIEMVSQAIKKDNSKVKKIKKEKGLIERTESSKIILTEDDKMLLNE